LDSGDGSVGSSEDFAIKKTQKIICGLKVRLWPDTHSKAKASG
jgi:hypothetical protein